MPGALAPRKRKIILPEEVIEDDSLPVDVRERVRRECWLKGRLRYLTRPGAQRRLYDQIHARSRVFGDFAPWVWNLHRRFGKTFLAILLLVEICLKAPRKRCKFACYTTSQAVEIIEEQFAVILDDCPPEVYPKQRKGEKFFFRNPRWPGGLGAHVFSLLRLYGTKDDKGNKMRGGSTDALAFDECREFQDLKYTWGHVCLPTFRGRADPLAIFLSTPPESSEHPWQSYYLPRAQERGQYTLIPARDNPDWTEEEDELFAEEMGGRSTSAYRREIQCELIADVERLAVPEFVLLDELDDEGSPQNPLVFEDEERPWPSHYWAFSVGDFGGSKDYYGIVFGYADFEAHEIVFRREIFFDYTNLDTRTVAESWKTVEAEAFDRGTPKAIVRRADAPQQRLTDLAAIYDLRVGTAPKQDRLANRNQFRAAVNLRRIAISSRCPELIYQLRNARRKPDGDFERTERMGHADVLAAAMYALKIATPMLQRNPFPDPVTNRSTHFVPPEAGGKVSWGSIFKGKRRRRRT